MGYEETFTMEHSMENKTVDNVRDMACVLRKAIFQAKHKKL